MSCRRIAKTDRRSTGGICSNVKSYLHQLAGSCRKWAEGINNHTQSAWSTWTGKRCQSGSRMKTGVNSSSWIRKFRRIVVERKTYGQLISQSSYLYRDRYLLPRLGARINNPESTGCLSACSPRFEPYRADSGKHAKNYECSETRAERRSDRISHWFYYSLDE